MATITWSCTSLTKSTIYPGESAVMTFSGTSINLSNSSINSTNIIMSGQVGDAEQGRQVLIHNAETEALCSQCYYASCTSNLLSSFAGSAATTAIINKKNNSGSSTVSSVSFCIENNSTDLIILNTTGSSITINYTTRDTTNIVQWEDGSQGLVDMVIRYGGTTATTAQLPVKATCATDTVVYELASVHYNGSIADSTITGYFSVNSSTGAISVAQAAFTTYYDQTFHVAVTARRSDEAEGTGRCFRVTLRKGLVRISLYDKSYTVSTSTYVYGKGKSSVIGTFTYSASTDFSNSSTTLVRAATVNSQISVGKASGTTVGVTKNYVYFTPNDTAYESPMTQSNYGTVTIVVEPSGKTNPTIEVLDGTIEYSTENTVAYLQGKTSVAGKFYFKSGSTWKNRSVTTIDTFVDTVAVGTTITQGNVGTYDIQWYFVPTDTTTYNSIGSSTSPMTNRFTITPKRYNIDWNVTTSYTYEYSTSARTITIPQANTGSPTISYSQVIANSSNLSFNPSTRVLTIAAGTSANGDLVPPYFITIRATDTPTDSNYTTNYKDVTISINITKTTPTITITNGTGVYGTATTTIYGKVKSNVAGKFYYAANVATLESSPSTQTASANGTYTIATKSYTSAGTTTRYAYFVPTDTTNYNQVDGLVVTATVSAGTMTITATGYSGAYDGQAHNVIVSKSTVNQKGTTVSPTYTYSTTETGTYSSTMPKVTNVGTYTYWIKATLSNYNAATTIVSVTVSKGTLTVTATGYSGTYDGQAHNVITSKSTTNQNGLSVTPTTYYYCATETGTYSATIPTVTNAGNYTYWIKARLNGYNDSDPVSVDVTVEKADNPMTVNTIPVLHYGTPNGTNSITISVSNAVGTVFFGPLMDTTNFSLGATTGVVTFIGNTSLNAIYNTTVGIRASGDDNYNGIVTSVDIKAEKDSVSSTTVVSTTYGTPSVVIIGSGLTAAGDSATITCTVTNTETYKATWTSGYVQNNLTRSVAGTARWKITNQYCSQSTDATSGTAITRFTHPTTGSANCGSVTGTYATGTKVSHSTMGTYLGNDYVTVTAYNAGDSTKSKSASTNIANRVTGVTAKASSGNTTHFKYTAKSTNPLYHMTANGDAINPSGTGAATYTFTSGSTTDDSSTSPSFGGSATYTRTYSEKTDSTNKFTVTTAGKVTGTTMGTTPTDSRSVVVTSSLTVKYTHPSTLGSGVVTSSALSHDFTVIQQANALVSITLTLGTSAVSKSGNDITGHPSTAHYDLEFGSSSTPTVIATYTTGSTLDVTSSATITSNPTGYVTIS